MDQYFKLHVKEITDFLRTIVIKFSYFEKLLNKDLDVSELNKEDYPYYRLLNGDHTLATTPIEIYTPTSNSKVLLTKDLVNTDEGMILFYKKNRYLLDKFIAEHPAESFLIRRIFDPVDITTAIEAKDFTILQLTGRFPNNLNEYEKNSLYTYLDRFVTYFGYRWYINTFEVEDLYPIASWTLLWYMLPLVLMTGRILNIRTNDVHPYYIWEYLISNGYADYYKYLNRDQEMFLYRNMDFLRKNEGKDFVLDILEKVFLLPIQCSTRDIDIVHSVKDRQDTADKLPFAKFISEGNTSVQSIGLFQDKLYASGLDDRNSPTYKEEVEDKLTHANTNHLLTKFLEIVKNKNYGEAFILFKFILDSAVIYNDRNLLDVTYTLKSTVMNVKLESLSFIDVLNIYHYVLHKRNGDVPEDLPTTYASSYAVTASSPPTLAPFFSNGLREADDYVDTDELFDSFMFTDQLVLTTEGFNEAISAQFEQLLSYQSLLRNTSGSLKYDTYKFILDNLVSPNFIVRLNQDYATYSEWLDANPAITEFLGQYDTEANDTYYIDLIREIFETICPLEYDFLYLNEDAVENVLFVTKITDLFKYITSYNINFITSETDNIQELPLPDLNGYMFFNDHSSLYVDTDDDVKTDIQFINFFEHDSLTIDIDDRNTEEIVTEHAHSFISVEDPSDLSLEDHITETINCMNRGLVLTEVE